MIGDDVWIGARVTLMPGVRIGKRAVIASGSVVSCDVVDDGLVAGSPATVLRTLAPIEVPRRRRTSDAAPSDRAAQAEAGATSELGSASSDVPPRLRAIQPSTSRAWRIPTT